MATVLKLCQDLIRSVDGAFRCTVIRLDQPRTLADILCLGSTFDRTVTNRVAQSLVDLDGGAPTLQVMQIATPDCMGFGITSHDGRVGLILLTAVRVDVTRVNAALSKLREQLEELADVDATGPS